MMQVTSLQDELKTLAEAQIEASQLIQQQEDDITRERKESEALRQKYKVITQLRIQSTSIG